MQEKALELWVRARTRLAEDRGQTAAEYMGILFIVAIIIGAIVAAGIHEDIADAADNLISDIAGGGRDE
jgi:hypothetical protein